MSRNCQALGKSMGKAGISDFPDTEVKVKPMQTNALNSDCTKTEKERLNRMLEEMFEEADIWLVEK